MDDRIQMLHACIGCLARQMQCRGVTRFPGIKPKRSRCVRYSSKQAKATFSSDFRSTPTTPHHTNPSSFLSQFSARPTSIYIKTDMDSPPTPFLPNKRKMGANQLSILQRVSDDIVDGFKKASPEKDMVMAFTVSQRYNADLLQNCDLPPPAKFFSGESDVMVRTAAMMQHQQPSPSSKVGEMEEEFTKGFSDDRLSLLRALRLSQTRAREAEKKIVEISAEKERLSALLLDDSVQILAHKQWLKLLETEVEYLHSQLSIPLRPGNEREQTGNANGSADGADAGSAWCVALAVCLGIASLGFVLGCRYLV